MYFLVPLMAAFIPFGLWPVEFFLPYPHIIEEIAKGALVFLLLSLPTLKQKIYATVLMAFLFSFSENILYTLNILPTGNSKDLLLRFAIVTPMQILTSLVILFFALINRKLIIIGIIAAAVLHFIFNLAVKFVTL